MIFMQSLNRAKQNLERNRLFQQHLPVRSEMQTYKTSIDQDFEHDIATSLPLGSETFLLS